MVAVWVMVVGLPSMGGDGTARTSGDMSLWAAAPVLVYLLTLGLAVDHFGARHGVAGSFGMHIIGVLVLMPVLWIVALANPGLEGGGVHASVTAAGWPVLFLSQALVAYAVAWVVPGSFPRQFRFPRAAWRVIRYGSPDQ